MIGIMILIIDWSDGKILVKYNVFDVYVSITYSTGWPVRLCFTELGIVALYSALLNQGWFCWSMRCCPPLLKIDMTITLPYLPTFLYFSRLEIKGILLAKLGLIYT